MKLPEYVNTLFRCFLPGLLLCLITSLGTDFFNISLCCCSESRASFTKSSVGFDVLLFVLSGWALWTYTGWPFKTKKKIEIFFWSNSREGLDLP